MQAWCAQSLHCVENRAREGKTEDSIEWAVIMVRARNASCLCISIAVILLIHAHGTSAADCSTVLKTVTNVTIFATDALQCMESPFPLDAANGKKFVLWVWIWLT